MELEPSLAYGGALAVGARRAVLGHLVRPQLRLGGQDEEEKQTDGEEEDEKDDDDDDDFMRFSIHIQHRQQIIQQVQHSCSAPSAPSAL